MTGSSRGLEIKEGSPLLRTAIMKNTQLYPFERNKYYYGMLLSVENFNAEQKYVNDKRRLINRLINGCGVVSGLNVVRIDEQTLSVESGLALDNTGREIVVSSPVTKKLAMINGFDTALGSGSAPYVYLCIEYKEEEKGQAYDLGSGGQNTACDRLREGYELFLTSAEPADDTDPVKELYEHGTTVFSDDKLRIRHVMPRFVSPLSELELRVEIETFTKQFISFSYDIQLICLTGENGDSSVLSVRFNEALTEKTGKYTLVYKLRSNNVTDAEASASIDPATFRLSCDNKPAEGTASGRSEALVVSGDISERIFRSAFDKDMDTLLRSSMSRRLYLARIDLVNAGETAVIENVTAVPFGQYVINNTLQYALFRHALMSLEDKAMPLGASGEEPVHASRANDSDVASGVCRIDLSSGSVKNKTFYSEEIIHGLGLGSVTVILGLKTKKDSTVYGDSEIFREDVPQIKVAAKLDPSKGSFVIGVMTTATVLDDFVEVKWTAIRDVDETVNDSSDMKILIKPNSLVLKPRESKYLDAVCMNMANKTLRWSVVPASGGNIDDNGQYTAPVAEGVYEVIAQSAVFPDVKASIMVVVRK